MLEYAKQILPKVCNWKDLFRKELIKSIEWAAPENRDEIYEWCFQNYYQLHEDVLDEVFQNRKRNSLKFGRIKNTESTTAIAVYKKPDKVNSQKNKSEKFQAEFF
jgi:hypothetical protein